MTYHQNFNHINQELFKPRNEDKLDSRRISELTTWNPDVSNEVKWTTSLDDASNKANESIELLFEAGFRYCVDNCSCKNVYIGIFNRHPRHEPVKCTI